MTAETPEPSSDAAAHEAAASPRGKLRGVTRIVQYNWPFYAGSALVCIVGGAALASRHLGAVPGTIVGVAVGCAALWTVLSLTVSWYVYDLSRLSRWSWVRALLGPAPRRWVSLHAGLDEASPSLTRLFPDAEGALLDFFDPGRMTEGSLRRSRRLTQPPKAPTPVPLQALPFDEASWDTAFLIFAAHEIRDAGDRLAFFRELHRVLEPEGHLLLVEHLRDLPNFLAFGPGFLHFWPRREWLRLARESGFVVLRDEPLTPFVRTLLLLRPS